MHVYLNKHYGEHLNMKIKK